MIDLSIVVPLYNEEESVTPLYHSICAALEFVEYDTEIIFVDDGSRDATFSVAERLAATDQRLRVIKFRRNYGQTPAMAAGIDIARGKIIVTMDGDLQNDPADIPNFVKKIEDGYDIVVGWRFDRKDKLISRKVPSRIANWLIGKVTGVPIKDNGCSLKSFRAPLIKQIPLYSEMHRFIPAIASMAGPKIAEIKVRHHARQFGKSKYGLSRVYKVLFDLLTIKMIVSFAVRPLTWFGLLALPFFLVASTVIIYSLIDLAADGTGSISIGGTGLFFAALSLFLIFGGALGELIIHTGYKNLRKFPMLTAFEFTSSDSGVLTMSSKTGIAK